MKLSISNIAWGKEYDLEMYKYISKLDFEGLEIAPTRIIESEPYNNLEKAIEFKENLKKEYNLNISSMQSIWFGKSQKIFGSIEERNELIEYTKKAIEFANAVKCNNLVFGCPKNRNINSKEDYKVAIEFFSQIGEYAKKYNTIFSIEPNPVIYNTNFINTTKDAFQIVKDINCEAVKVNVDLGTIIYNEEKISSIEENINLVNHIHISEPNLESIKQREIHKDFSNMLYENKYDKYVSIEMKNLDDIDKVKNTMLYVKEVF